jgi:hypothetical protein
MRRVLYAVIACFVLASPGFPQQNTGALKGTVTDPHGSLVIDARVSLKNARGVTTSATTNTPGVY